MENYKEYDYIIIGAGIIGLTIAYELRKSKPGKSIAIIEKEADVAFHASGRNSGVLHAGFYYSSDSLKAKFSIEGNRLMKKFCENNDLKVNYCKKVVVAVNEEELSTLIMLAQRGKANGVKMKLIDEEELQSIEPNSKTYKKALYSPTTASVDPIEICQKLKAILSNNHVDFYFNTKFLKKHNGVIKTNNESFKIGFLINAAGLYADVIAKKFGFSKNRIIIPFKGRYLKYSGVDLPIKTNIYPVPNLLNPFLGVHYTITSRNHIKIGPTSFPSFWRENYKGFQNFKLNEFLEIMFYQAKLFITNSFNFRGLVYGEIKKYNRKYFILQASKLTKQCNENLYREWLSPGIRAQLLNKKTLELEMDFIIEGDHNSLHILNAVSPAFTCSFAIAKYLVHERIK